MIYCAYRLGYRNAVGVSLLKLLAGVRVMRSDVIVFGHAALGCCDGLSVDGKKSYPYGVGARRLLAGNSENGGLSYVNDDDPARTNDNRGARLSVGYGLGAVFC